MPIRPPASRAARRLAGNGDAGARQASAGVEIVYAGLLLEASGSCVGWA